MNISTSILEYLTLVSSAIIFFIIIELLLVELFSVSINKLFKNIIIFLILLKAAFYMVLASRSNITGLILIYMIIFIFIGAFFILANYILKRFFSFSIKKALERILFYIRDKAYALFQGREKVVKNLKILFFVIMLVLVSRLMLFVLGYLITAISNENFFVGLEGIWKKWDSFHYINIAENGYARFGHNKFLIVFYPLYPLLIKVFNFIFNDYFFSGIVVSNFFLVVACFYFYKLMLIDHDESISRNGIIILLIYPFSFFLSIVFTESTFLAFSIICFYYMRKNKWILVGIAGFFASLTKNQGILLFAPAIIEYINNTDLIDKIKLRSLKSIIKDFFTKGIFIIFILFGFFVYLLINKIITDDWFRFLKYQKENWHSQFGFFPQVIKSVFENGFHRSVSERILLWFPQLFSFIFTIVLIFYSFGKQRTSYIVYMFIFLIISFSPSWLLSSSRYLTNIFQIYIALAIFSQNKLKFLTLFYIFNTMLMFFTFSFVKGFPVM